MEFPSAADTPQIMKSKRQRSVPVKDSTKYEYDFRNKES